MGFRKNERNGIQMFEGEKKKECGDSQIEIYCGERKEWPEGCCCINFHSNFLVTEYNRIHFPDMSVLKGSEEFWKGSEEF